MVNIVTVTVSQQVAPAPATLQRKGAFVSQGATTTAPGTVSLLTQLADLTAILTGAKAITSITWSGSVATVTATAPHGFTTSDTLQLTIAGVTPAGYNGTFLATVTGASTFTYPLVSNPGSETVPGVYTPEDVAELLAMGTTFFAQGSAVPISVLELGAGNPVDGCAYLTTWIAANPKTIYSYLVPRTWDGAAAYLTLIASFEATTSMTYFWTTTTTGTYSGYTALMKDVYALVEAPTIPATEFSLASNLYRALGYNPSSTNKVAPFVFGYLSGVTKYPTTGNAALLATLRAANINIVADGTEGGVSNTMIAYGRMKDARPFNYWYSVDWVQINSSIALNNVVFNGSNDPTNPLYYDQNGINRLQAREAGVMANAVTFGLAVGSVVQTELTGDQLAAAIAAGTYAGKCVVNAVPFVAYLTANPSDFRAGVYNGLSVTYIPAQGFEAIGINLVVSDFVTQ